MHELPDLSGLSVAEKDALILSLFEQGKRCTATVQALSARLKSCPICATNLDVTGIAIGRAQAQYILCSVPGSAESAPNRRHRPGARKKQT